MNIGDCILYPHRESGGNIWFKHGIILDIDERQGEPYILCQMLENKQHSKIFRTHLCIKINSEIAFKKWYGLWELNENLAN
jgi:hypothetical protein